MKNTMELLEELEMAIRELRPFLNEEAREGTYLHADIGVSASPETLQKLIDEIKMYTAKD
jgi:hypothetical protein